MGLVKGILDGIVNGGLYDLMDVLRAPETETSRTDLSNTNDGLIFWIIPRAQS